jgi:hypothetical protein
MYMEALGELLEAISQLDAYARGLVSSALAEGNFDEVATLTPIAKDVAALAARWPPGPSSRPTSKSHKAARDAAQPSQNAPNGSDRLSRHKESRFPQFVREQDDLVKLGWSSRDEKVYEHRVSKGTVNVVTRAVAGKGKLGQRFSMDQLLTSIHPEKGDEAIPSYQVYAVISWLKENGMLLQHGRQGYTVVRPQTFTDSVQTAWEALHRR